MEAFLDLTAELGLLVILRPGPYICAEWEMVSPGPSLAQWGDGGSGKGTAGLTLLAVVLTPVPCQLLPQRPQAVLVPSTSIALAEFSSVQAQAAEQFLCLPLCCVCFSRVACLPGCCGNQTSSCGLPTLVRLSTGLWPPCPYSLMPVQLSSTHLPALPLWSFPSSSPSSESPILCAPSPYPHLA